MKIVYGLNSMQQFRFIKFWRRKTIINDKNLNLIREQMYHMLSRVQVLLNCLGIIYSQAYGIL